MKKFVGAMVVALIASSAAAQFVDYTPEPKPKPRDQVGMTKKQFDKVKEGLMANAKSLVLAEPKTPDLDSLILLRQIGYDKDTWEMVKKHIDELMKLKGKAAQEPQRLYVIVKLLSPLIVSKTDVIRQALPTVRKVDEQYHMAYKLYPTLSQDRLAKIAVPVLPRGKDGKVIVDPAKMMRLLAEMQKEREKKAIAEQPATIGNTLIGDLDTIYVKLMAFAGDKEEDKKLVEFIFANEQPNPAYKGIKNHIWTIAVEALNSEIAAGMSADRAAVLYPVMYKYGKAYEWDYKKYQAWYLPEFNADTNSVLPDRNSYTGYVLLTSAKLLAKAAKMPAIVVHNPNKSNKEKWGKDPEYWPIEKTKKDKDIKD